MDGDIQVIIAIISLISAIVGLIATIAGRKQVLEIRNVDNDISNQEDLTLITRVDMSHQSSNLNWYDKTKWLVVAFVVFWPIGLYGFFKSRAVSNGWKLVVSITFLVLAVVAAVIG